MIFKGRFLAIKEGIYGISELNLNEDPIWIKEYIGKRLSKNKAGNIINNHSILGLDPNIINLLYYSPGSSIPVERSFSHLGKMIYKGSQFNKDEIKYYISAIYNKMITLPIVEEINTTGVVIQDWLAEFLGKEN